MQEHRAAAAGDARAGVVIELDDEIIEMILAPEPIAAALRIHSQRLVVAAIRGILAPRVLRGDGAYGKKRRRFWMPVGAPPQLPRPECAFRRGAVAFALVRLYAAAPQRYRDGSAGRDQPAAGGIAGGGPNPHQCERRWAPDCWIRH